MIRSSSTVCLISLLFACSSDSRIDETTCTAARLDAEQKRRAEELTSIFENGTTEIQYAYAEALGDGRGVTAGRAGFTSATGDLVEVVRRYVEQVPGSDLAAYLPRLEVLAENEDDSVDGLEGLIEAWAAAAEDAAFRTIQDQVVDEMHYQPALARAEGAGVCLPLSIAIFYDSIIQHGDGEDPDGLPALIERTTTEVGSSPQVGADEREWIRAFVGIRRHDLESAFDPDTRAVWAESAGRCDVLLEIANAENWWLDGPIVVDSGDYMGTIE